MALVTGMPNNARWMLYFGLILKKKYIFCYNTVVVLYFIPPKFILNVF